MSEGGDEAEPAVIVCQGPPRCPLEGDDAVAAAEAGCVWCERHRVLDSGEWHVTRPASA